MQIKEMERLKHTFQYFIPILFIGLWLYAAQLKFVDIEKSMLQMSKSPLLNGYQQVLAWAIPLTELTLALFITIGLGYKKLLPFGLYGSFALLSLFTFYIIAILNFSYYIPCSCGGIFEKLSWQQHLLFNIGTMIVAATQLLLTASKQEIVTREYPLKI